MSPESTALVQSDRPYDGASSGKGAGELPGAGVGHQTQPTQSWSNCTRGRPRPALAFARHTTGGPVRGRSSARVGRWDRIGASGPRVGFSTPSSSQARRLQLFYRRRKVGRSFAAPVDRSEQATTKGHFPLWCSGQAQAVNFTNSSSIKVCATKIRSAHN